MSDILSDERIAEIERYLTFASKGVWGDYVYQLAGIATEVVPCYVALAAKLQESQEREQQLRERLGRISSIMRMPESIRDTQLDDVAALTDAPAAQPSLDGAVEFANWLATEGPQSFDSVVKGWMRLAWDGGRSAQPSEAERLKAKIAEATEIVEAVLSHPRIGEMHVNFREKPWRVDFLIRRLLADAPAAQRSKAERLKKALSAIDELMPVAGILPECDLSDDALVYQGSATSENWRCHVPMGVVAIWPQLTEPIRLLVFLCCFPASQHRCGGYAEAGSGCDLC